MCEGVEIEGLDFQILRSREILLRVDLHARKITKKETQDAKP